MAAAEPVLENASVETKPRVTVIVGAPDSQRLPYCKPS